MTQSFGLFIGLLIGLMIPVKTEMKSCTYNLEALQDNNGVSGSYFLGTGSIEGKMKYVYYYRDADSLYHMKQYDYENASIKYSTDEPKIIITKEHVVNPKDATINYFGLKTLFNESAIIYIPKGSIKQNFTLDAQ